ncbi:MAG: thiamine pyrophosphate-binding protein [Candidatus Muproteobacteria bacterium RBG_16_65_31]|uniref:Thiamine pyrophosphate-binding protein n=1 Tax=Candidatus Muproteobacteria bacterium RBG_16_65_31 TaxID=1817759 RepID=A0A1F6TH45_9PROT|nr:MAG: thiamine pyrophosphate-binding protein [Candidatus Muproteobacteria bacterium RBG_16_65_31]
MSATEKFAADFIDQEIFEKEILGAYQDGSAEQCLPADRAVALSWMPPATGALRDFSTIAPDLPELDAAKCVGCMECVTQCPDTAILAKIVPAAQHAALVDKLGGEEHGDFTARQFAKTTKYFDVPARKGHEGGMFFLVTDPGKCKGCGECVTACGDHQALRMIPKTDRNLEQYRAATSVFRKLPDTPRAYIQDKVLSDMMLRNSTHLFVGGAASCMGCGETTAIRMMLTATAFVHGENSMGIIAATGCNTVYGSTYPHNPYKVPWTNSLFENAPAVAMGVRARWDQRGLKSKRLWVLGGDGAMLDIGFQALSRMLMSGMDIKVLVLDTQVYSNTGGQASTATFLAQDSKMAAYGKSQHGKTERRKELAQIAMMHPGVYVAQTTCAHVNHFYRAILAANEYPGPAIVNVYTPCQPEHGIGDDASVRQSKLAVDARAFPLLVYDPRAGESLKERLNLQGNPARKDDWYVTPKGETVNFVSFARTEGRFAKHFDQDGNPSPALLKAQEDRLKNWRLLQELAGLR